MFNNIIKILFSFYCLLFSLNFFICGPEEYSYTSHVYNNRSEIILECSRGILQVGEEKCATIQPNSKQSYYSWHKPKKPLPSELLVYFKIKLEDGTELLNLQGKALDDFAKVVEETEFSITYRLDVN